MIELPTSWLFAQFFAVIDTFQQPYYRASL